MYKDAKLALLHCPIQGLVSYQQKLATCLFIAAKRAIARAWKKPSVSIAVVRSIMSNLMINEKMLSILHDSHTIFLKIWSPWWSYALPTIPLISLDAS